MKTLRVGAAFPIRLSAGMPDNGGLDIGLMTAIAKVLRHHGRSGRAGAERNVATDTPEMAGQPRRRPKFGGALNQPARGGITPLGWPLSIKAKKGETSDHPGRR